ncbi:MAG TPA: hypothetical protein PK819_07435 [Thermomicrobiales bacterium]|nr:hypothetical protein [Thermomicrobiales bacterium]
MYGSGSQVGGKRITLRVQLTAPAGKGGVDVALFSSNNAVLIPAKVHIDSGATEKEFLVPTEYVQETDYLTISAKLDGVTRSRILRLRTITVSSIGLQRVIRHGGLGKFIVRLNGPAPAGGYHIWPRVLGGDQLKFAPEGYVIPEGQNAISIKVLAISTSSVNEETGRYRDQYVWAGIETQYISMHKQAIVRDFGDEPRPTMTPTRSPTAEPTETPTIGAADSIETATPLPAATDTAGDPLTPTDTANSDLTPTEIPVPTQDVFDPPVEVATPL